MIEAVKRVSGVDFKVETAPRRLGDSARIVADSAQIRKALQWQPRFDDLATIVHDALAWERSLLERGSAAGPGRRRKNCHKHKDNPGWSKVKLIAVQSDPAPPPRLNPSSPLPYLFRAFPIAIPTTGVGRKMTEQLFCHKICHKRGRSFRRAIGDYESRNTTGR